VTLTTEATQRLFVPTLTTTGLVVPPCGIVVNTLQTGRNTF